MKWNAWGDPASAKPLSDGIRSLLKQAVGLEDSGQAELTAEQVRLRANRLKVWKKGEIIKDRGKYFIKIEEMEMKKEMDRGTEMELEMFKEIEFQQERDVFEVLRIILGEEFSLIKV